MTDVDLDRAEKARMLLAAITAKSTGEDTFVCDMPDWFGQRRVFGGIIVAQALNAAVQTVDDRPPHSLHGYFLRPARPGQTADLRVEHVRDGRTFRTRHVDMTQGDDPVFWMACSFHGDETGDEYQLSMPSGTPRPDELETSEMPGPFDVREIGPTAREPDGTYRSTRRAWYRCAGSIPDDDRAHLSVAAFLSDMTHSAFRPHSLGSWGTHTDASLDHALWFHRPFRVDDWLYYDLQAVINAGGRSLVRGSLYREDGALCLTMTQELLIRPLSGN